MRIDLDAKVKTADGHDAGHVRRVILDPVTQKITGFVVSTGGLFGHDVIVGEDDFVSASPDAHELALRLSKSELGAQAPFAEGSFVPPPSGFAATMGYGFPSNAYLIPAAADAPEAIAEPQRPTLKKGDTVKDRDGDLVGVVEDVRFDDHSKEITGFVVRVGAGIERLLGGGQLADIRGDEILRVFEGEVRLAIDREELRASERESEAR
jgi:uncharacterized protein YrrD